MGRWAKRGALSGKAGLKGGSEWEGGLKGGL